MAIEGASLQDQLADILEDESLRSTNTDDTNNDQTQDDDNDDDSNTPRRGKAEVDPEDQELDADGPPKKDAKTTDNKQQQNKQQQQKPQQRPQPRFEGMNEDQIARRRAEHAAAGMRVEMNNLKQQNEAYKAAFNSYSAVGLRAEDVPHALKMIADFRTDPMGTIKKLLTELQGMGHDVSSITGGGGSFDAAAVKRMVDEAVRPLVGEQQTRTQQHQLENAIRREFDEFMGAYPHAQANLPLLNQMYMQAPDGMTLQEVWLRIENWAYKNGLDPTRPLRDQQGASSDTTNAGGRRGIPNGRFPTRVDSRSSSSATRFNPNASNRDIVRAALEEVENQMEQ